MDTQTLDHRIDTLLNDPLVSLMIRADSVDRAMLACQMRRLGRSVDERQVRDEASTGGAL
ncbi:hypothetical protein [Rhodoblastus sp.]|jgi:hypothetical protein|uniref:hypothetical protein n=1 Tax=Rhodoblastus sp. TaxID=1962975 RepID=UPI0025F1D1A1|nr:hypothetical protein [Rhodoblastus sp.]